MAESSVLDFTMTGIDGKPKKLSDYRGRVLLIVNVASQCGFTYQYGPLEKLYQTYKDRNFSILAFPANDFGAQEPGTDAEIKTFCETKFGVTFDMFSKISVKGESMHPLYGFLTSQPGFEGPVGWNFNKFVIDRNGNIVARFSSKVEPTDKRVTAMIEELMKGEK